MYDPYQQDRVGPHWGDYTFGVSHDHEQLSQDPQLADAPPQPRNGCPPGQMPNPIATGLPGAPACVPEPSGIELPTPSTIPMMPPPLYQPAKTETKKELPSWVIPAAVAGVGLVAIAFALGRT
jgi:hypothetical protein